MYHFVWIPKYRKKVFEEPYHDVLKKVIDKIGYDYNIEIIELEIAEDHIHTGVRYGPKVSPSAIMQRVKSLAAREFLILS
jgi:putative transposase